MRKKLREDIDYGDYPERMGRGAEASASDPEGLYAKNPAMRRNQQDVEDLMVARFKKLTDHLRRVTNINDLSSRQVQQMLFGEMMQSLVPRMIRIEDQHKEQLEQLAIEASLDETEVPSDWFEIEASLIRGPLDSSDFRLEPEEENDDENEEDNEEEDEAEIPSFDVEDLTQDEILELEKHKRNIINALIQGAAKKGHHIYDKPEVKQKLDQLDANLHPLYKKVMAITDFLYFSLDDYIESMSETGSGIAGKVKLSDSDDDDSGEGGEEKPDTKIIAQGLFFPILCHEIVKGIKEASGRHGLPKDPVLAQQVMGQTDVLRNEPMQLRIGPEIYEKLRLLLPDEMFHESNKGLAPWFEMVLFQIDANDFLKNIIANVISTDPDKNNLVKSRFEEIMKEAIDLKSEYEDYKEDNNIPPDSDDGLDDFLSGLGISLPSNDE